MLSRWMLDRLPQAVIKNNILATIYTGFFCIIQIYISVRISRIGELTMAMNGYNFPLNLENLLHI